MTRLVGPLVALVLLGSLGACTGETGAGGEVATADQRPGAEAPEAAVTGLLSALQQADYDAAAGFGAADQLPILAMIEGATIEQISGLSGSDDLSVGVNFWRSFAEGLEDFVGVAPDQIRIADVTPFEIGDRRFARVAVEFPNDANVRSFVAQERNGWWVDLLASFGPALASRLEAAVTALRAEPGSDDVLQLAADQRPSLEAVLADPAITPEVDQDVRAALVAISR